MTGELVVYIVSGGVVASAIACYIFMEYRYHKLKLAMEALELALLWPKRR